MWKNTAQQFPEKPPRSLDYDAGHTSDRVHDHDPYLMEAVEFLHRDQEFLIAAEIGNDKLLDIYIRRGVDIQQLDFLGRNALHLAVCADNYRAIQLLLDAGVNPDLKDNLGMTPLSLCLMRRPSVKVVNLLFSHGAKILPRTSPMDTGLFNHYIYLDALTKLFLPDIEFVMMCTPTLEEEKILRLMVKKGAPVNDLSAPGGRQVLHFAAMSNNTKLIAILVSLGADLYLRNHKNETPKEVAATFNCKEAFDLLEYYEDIRENTDNNDYFIE